MASRAPEDEFERILERCRSGLSEISLDLPDIDPAPAPPPIRLVEDPPPPPAPAPPPPPPEPAPAPKPVLKPAPATPTPRPSPRPTPIPRPSAPALPRLRDIPWRAAALATATLILCAAAYRNWSRLDAKPLTLELARVDAMSDALGTGKGKLVIAAGRVVTVLDDKGRSVETRSLPVPVAAMSMSAGSLWTVDGRTPTIVEHRADGTSSSFTVNHVPAALDAHEKYLWTTDEKSHQIHQYLITRSMLGLFLQPLDLYDLPGLSVDCFDMDYEGVLWLVDGPSRRLFRLKAEEAVYKPMDSTPLTPLVGNSGRIKGLAIKNGRLWLLVSPEDGTGPSVLKRLSISSLRWTAS